MTAVKLALESAVMGLFCTISPALVETEKAPVELILPRATLPVLDAIVVEPATLKLPAAV